LDKRYYIPTLDVLSVYDKKLNDDLIYSHHSIFYHYKFDSSVQHAFNKYNMFFYDKSKYSNNSLDFLTYQVYPTIGNVDFFFKQKRSYGEKSKILNFKLYSDIQMQEFERFYLSHHLFIADNFEYN